MRKFLSAILLVLGLTQSFAQSPPAVPALPDTARIATFSLSASTCSCSVPFAIYGSGTDVDQWISVYVNGVAKLSTDPTFGWGLTSVTGSLGSIPRPITNAVLTFNAAQTATVVIVGNQRPRRLSQFSENRGVPARDLNQAITTDIAALRELWDKSNRSIVGQPGDILLPLPSVAARAGQYLCFDSGGNPVPCQSATPGTLTLPGSSVNGDSVCFSGTTGKSFSDCGYAITGTLALGQVPIATGATTAVWGTVSSSVVLQVANYTGVDAAAQMNACLVAIPATGGTCDARSIAGTQVVGSTIAVPDNATLLLCGLTLRSAINPIMTYGSGSRIIGCSQQTTTIEGFNGGNNQVGIRPRNIAVDTSNATISDLAILMFGTSGTVGLQVIRHIEGVFENLTFNPTGDTTNTSIYLAANAGIGYYNQFYNMRVSGGGRAIDIEGNANENKFYGGFLGSVAYCFYFGPSDHNVSISTSCENWTVEAVHFEATAAGNHLLAMRAEGYAGGSILVNNQSTSIESMTDTYVGGIVNSITDPNGTLDFSTNFAASGGNKWTKHAPLQAQAYIAGSSPPTLTGSCVVVSGTQHGGNTAGDFAIPAGNCVATTTVIMAFSTTAQTGWACDAHNLNTPTSIIDQTGKSATGATFTIRSVTSAAADVVTFKCMGY